MVLLRVPSTLYKNNIDLFTNRKDENKTVIINPGGIQSTRAQNRKGVPPYFFLLSARFVYDHFYNVETERRQRAGKLYRTSVQRLYYAYQQQPIEK